MSDLAIRVENLSKQYRIGGPQGRFKYKTIRESIVEAARAPIRRVGRLLQGQAYGAADMEETIWALKNVSFDVKRGEVVGIIGRNGAGKSTLLKILSRITEPTEGYAEIHGRVGSLLEVGTGFHPELTGRENIYLNGAILGMKRVEIDRKFDEIVDFAEIEKFIDTPVKHYSSGMYVRLAFAVAAHLEPEILLVDEVLAVGDHQFQNRCLGRMQKVAREGRTVLFVSHNMPAITRLCRSALCLENGSVILSGISEHVVQSYLARGAETKARVEFETDQNKDAQITSIELMNDLSQLSPDFDVSMPIHVLVRFHAHRMISDHRIIVALSDTNGTEIFVTNSTDQGQPIRRLEPGGYTATLIIPDRLLAAGRYFLSAYVDEPNVKTHDRQERVISFSVSGDPYRANERRRGLIVYPFEWRTSPTSPKEGTIGQRM
jgi:lipopolysaccharide transport system ATP-binding protein